jgi:hypothetical protein
LAPLMHGEEDGEEDEAPDVDEGRCKDVEDACAREDKDHGDRAETEAVGKSDVSEGGSAWRDVGGRSRKEDGDVSFVSRQAMKMLALILRALALKKNDPGISGVISHDGLTISGRLEALEKPHGRLATLPAP